jgi:hypothetical protein
VSAAADVAELPQDEQREIVARGEKEILAVAKEIRARGNAKRRAEWEARAVQLANAAAPLPRDRRYPILLADPPWPFAAYAAESGLARSAESHYPTLSIKKFAHSLLQISRPPTRRSFCGPRPHICRIACGSWMRGASRIAPTSSG